MKVSSWLLVIPLSLTFFQSMTNGFTVGSLPASRIISTWAKNHQLLIRSLVVVNDPSSALHSNKEEEIHSSNDVAAGNNGKSRILGNQVEPTEDQLEIMDEMIRKLQKASMAEIPLAMQKAFRVISSPKFFLRIAELADTASDENERQELTTLATTLTKALESVVASGKLELDQRSLDLRAILQAAAEPGTGEFFVPLTPSQIQDMRIVMEELEPRRLDEAFLTTVDSWMNKSVKDGMDGMFLILQKVLQLYSGIQLFRARQAQKQQQNATNTPTPSSILFDKLLSIDADEWKKELQRPDRRAILTHLISDIHKTMETIVLELQTGSMAQRVQAEYVRGLVATIEAIRSDNSKHEE